MASSRTGPDTAAVRMTSSCDGLCTPGKSAGCGGASARPHRSRSCRRARGAKRSAHAHTSRRGGARTRAGAPLAIAANELRSSLEDAIRSARLEDRVHLLGHIDGSAAAIASGRRRAFVQGGRSATWCSKRWRSGDRGLDRAGGVSEVLPETCLVPIGDAKRWLTLWPAS